MNKFKITLLALLMSCFSSAYAIQLTAESELHGFVSQSFVYSPDNAYAGTNTNTGSFDFREIGLNGAWEINENFRVTGQVLSRKVGESADGSLQIDFLLMDYLAHSTAESNFGVRLGRVKNAIGLYNSTRDIPTARPGLAVPSSIYFDSFRDTILSTDGVNLYGSYFAESGTLSWEVSSGVSGLESEVMEDYLFGTEVEPGELDKVRLSGLKVDFSPNKAPGLLMGVSVLKVGFNLDDAQTTEEAYSKAVAASGGDSTNIGLIQQEIYQNIGNYVTSTELDSLVGVLYAQYAYQDWVFSVEYLNIYTDLTIGIVGDLVTEQTTSEAFYLQSEWFFRENMSALVRYEELYLDADDRDGSDKPRAADSYYAYGKGLTFGLSWDFQESWRLVGQVGINEGTVWLPVSLQDEQAVLKRDWNTYMLQLSYQF